MRDVNTRDIVTVFGKMLFIVFVIHISRNDNYLNYTQLWVSYSLKVIYYNYFS
jgi:hypothetical protein